MKFTDEEGKVWEWRGEYRDREKGDWFLSREGNLLYADISGVAAGDICPRAIIHPVPTIHEFGGVKFEETGEVRQPKEEEWVLSREGNFAFWFYPGRFITGHHSIILRPLQGE